MINTTQVLKSPLGSHQFEEGNSRKKHACICIKQSQLEGAYDIYLA